MNFDNVIAVRKNKTVYRDGNKCLKVFNPNYSKSDIFNETLSHARVEEAGIILPKILEVTTKDDRWVIVSEYIEGKTIEQLMNENPEKHDEYMNLFVDIQLNMHSKSSPLLNVLKYKLHRRINETNLSEVTKYDLHTRLEAMPNHNKICHGDYNPSNVIITADGTPYIIDWPHTTQGNASADTARTYLLFYLNNGKEMADEYLNLFCKKSGTSTEYVKKWLPIVAAAQLAKNIEGEHDFLLQWINVVDY